MNQIQQGFQNILTDSVIKIQFHIESHLSEELPLVQLADLAGFSRFHFHRIFSGFTGETVAEYRRRLRLEAAATALQFTQKPVVEVALDAGYGSHEAFSRAFQRRFGYSPSGFRNHPNPVELRLQPVQHLRDFAEVEIRTIEPKQVAYLRHTGPYCTVTSTFERLMDWAASVGAVDETTQILGICLDDPDEVEPDELRYDCCVSLSQACEVDAPVQLQTIPGGHYAVLQVKGSYSLLMDSYRWLLGMWLPNSGRKRLNQPSFELVLPLANPANEERWLAEIYLPLE